MTIRTVFLPDGWRLHQLERAVRAGCLICAGKRTPGVWLNVREHADGSWERI